MAQDKMKAIIDQAEQDLLHTYNRYQIVLDRGEGSYLYDVNGKKYLDFMAGIAVFAFGYNHKKFNDAVKAQLDKIVHTSNYFYNEPSARAAHRIKEISGMDRVFFTNSGAEAVEGALKAAIKYAYLKDGRTDHQIIAMEHSFHGRTYGALSVTGNAHYREPFGVEPVQGEGGLISAEESFLRDLRAICDEKDILLIFDEIQCGMGRTGSMFAWQKFGIKPDIMTTAKALGCGIPVGAFLMTEKVGTHSLVAGDHGTTYGGNPLAAAAINAVLDIYEEDHIVDNVNTVAPYLTEKLDALAAKYSCITEHRGRGLMQGLVFDRPVGPIILEAMDQGLILINAGAQIIRFVPPLNISREQIDEMAAILDAAIGKVTA